MNCNNDREVPDFTFPVNAIVAHKLKPLLGLVDEDNIHFDGKTVYEQDFPMHIDDIKLLDIKIDHTADHVDVLEDPSKIPAQRLDHVIKVLTNHREKFLTEITKSQTHQENTTWFTSNKALIGSIIAGGICGIFTLAFIILIGCHVSRLKLLITTMFENIPLIEAKVSIKQ